MNYRSFLGCCLMLPILLFAQPDPHTLTIDGRERSYLLQVPANLPVKAPLILVLHGYGDSAAGMWTSTRFVKMAEKEGFVVCFPQGWLGGDQKHSWNAGYSNPEVDDVKFLTALIQHLQSAYQLDPQKTFCTGMSNGADMSYVMACQAADQVVAIAPVAGCMMQDTYDHCQHTEAMPVLEIHGTADSITLWAGDPDYLPGSGGYLGTEAVMNFWKQHNECQRMAQDTLVDTDPTDGSWPIRTRYVGGNAPVHLYTLVNGKHDWPGGWGNQDFYAEEVIWAFFGAVMGD